MQNWDVGKAIKLVIILGIIFCAISFLLPWRGMSMGYMGISIGADFYTWGSHSYMSSSNPYMPANGETTSVNMWSIFYSFNLGAPEPGTTDTNGGSFTFTPFEVDSIAITLFILAFIFCIITLIIGILALKKKKACLIAGITSILSIILFVIGFTIVLSIDPSGFASGMIPYTFGFFMMIISMILFFIAYILNYILGSQPTEIPQESYNESGYEPPKQL